VLARGAGDVQAAQAGGVLARARSAGVPGKRIGMGHVPSDGSVSDQMFRCQQFR
jgi:hypothetical protein